MTPDATPAGLDELKLEKEELRGRLADAATAELRERIWQALVYVRRCRVQLNGGAAVTGR